MKILSERTSKLKRDAHTRACPYNGIDTCQASLSSMMIDKKRKEDYCGDENYDDCPIYLAKILRMVSKDSSLKREAHYEF
jgi:hypothetical protein